MRYDAVYLDSGATIFKGCKLGEKGKLIVEVPEGDDGMSGNVGNFNLNFPSGFSNCGSSKNWPCNYCSPCTNGHISAGAQTTCQRCPPGTRSNSDRTECVPCPLGNCLPRGRSRLRGLLGCRRVLYGWRGLLLDEPGGNFGRSGPHFHCALFPQHLLHWRHRHMLALFQSRGVLPHILLHVVLPRPPRARAEQLSDRHRGMPHRPLLSRRTRMPALSGRHARPGRDDFVRLVLARRVL